MDAAPLTAAFIEQAPGLGAALIIVLLFLRAQAEQTEAWRQFLADERKARSADNDRILSVLERLILSCGVIHQDLLGMDTYVRTSLEAMRKARNKPKAE
jgi:hypothetical protein